jgi:hypothetical protein
MREESEPDIACQLGVLIGAGVGFAWPAFVALHHFASI